MSFVIGMKTGSRAAPLALVAAFALACNVERDDLVFQKGDFVFDFLVDASLAGGLPAGSERITDFDVAIVDTTKPDGFERSVSGNGWFFSPAPGLFNCCAGWDLEGLDRNATTDPRLPALTDSDAFLEPGADKLVILDPSGLCGSPCSFHNPFTNGATLKNLKPSTTYIVALFRYAVRVNGALDQVQVITGRTGDPPDQLVPLGGTPQGDPNRPIVTFPTIVALPADANPFVLGNFTTNVAGEGGFDVVISGPGRLYRNNSGNPPAAALDSSLVGRNDETPTTFPRYNYLVIIEGPATDAADAADNPQALRFQVAQDFNLPGGMVNNGYAPFPKTAFTKAQLLASPCCAGRASDLSFTFRNLAELSGGVYQVWLFNEETGEKISPTGNWVATELDAEGTPVTVGSADGVRTFNSKNTWTHTFRTSDGLAGQPVGLFTHVFLSIESSEAAAPSPSQPLWARYTDMKDAPEDPFQWEFAPTASLVFGTFNLGEPTVWKGGGLGKGGFWGEKLGETDRLVVVYRNLPIPPRGFFFEGWLIDGDGNSVPAGELTAPLDENFVSLRNVDEDQTISTKVRPDLIVESVTRALKEELPAGREFFEFEEYRLSLSPKLRVEGVRPPTTALGALTPDPLRARRPQEGQ